MSSTKSRIENSKYCIFAILITQGSVGCLCGLNLSLLNTSAPAIKKFINDSYTERYGETPTDVFIDLIYTIAQSVNDWGWLVGSLLVKFVLQRFSRKESILCCHIPSIFSVILMGPVATFGKSYESLIVGRFIGGIATGIGFSSTMVVVAETSCHRKVGLFQSPFSTLTFVGSAIAAGLGHRKVLGTPGRWIYLACTPAVPSLIYILSWSWIPEPPVSLLRACNREKAVEVLRKLRTNADVSEEIDVMQKEINEKANTQALPIMTILKNSRLRMQFFTASVTVIASQLTGIQAIFMYSDFILLDAGISADHVTFVTIGLYLLSLVAFLMYYPVQRRFGTRKVFIAGVCVISMGYIIFTVSNALHETISVMSYVALGAMCIFLFGILFGPELTILSLSSELTTAASRPTVAFYSGIAYSLISCITSFVFPYSVGALGAYAYIPYIVFSLSLIPFGIFLVPETHDRSAAEIQNTFLMKARQSLGTLFSFGDRMRRPRSQSKSSDVREVDLPDDPTASGVSITTVTERV